MRTQKKLTIIIPYYNAKVYCDKLLEVLNKQITDEVQVIVVDDGSANEYSINYNWVEIYRKENGGASSARNYGLDKAIGEYVSFIDSDDLVSENYIATIIEKIDSEHFDYCYLSWKTLPGGWQCDVKLNSIEDKFPDFNLCCWNRVYSREMIGDIRFNENKAIAEDAEFIRDVSEDGKKKAFISDYLYFYRSDTPNSLTKKFANGELYMKRFVFNYNHITSKMTNLIDLVKEYNKIGEVIIMTNKNDLPELAKYAMITKPCQMKGTELIGENTNLFTKIELPIKTQIVIWTQKTFAIGGIETFIYDFCMNMKDDYDIVVLYDSMDITQINRLKKHVMVVKNIGQKIVCDTVIVNRITDSVPKNVSYKKKIQMVHSCQIYDTWHVPIDNDYIVPVSNAVRDSFIEEIKNSKYEVINNFTYKEDCKPALRLISGSRFTAEKGEQRIYQLAQQLNDNNIPFVWMVFSDYPIKKGIPGLVQMNPTLDIRNYIASCDYLVQLSDSEAFCYSLVEALELGIPVITTPLDVLDEIKVVDGVNGWIVPFNMQNIDVNKIYETKLKFKYSYNNVSIKKKWKKLLGESIPLHDYNYANEYKLIQVIKQYQDLQLKRQVKVGEVLEVTNIRAEQIKNAGYCVIL